MLLALKGVNGQLELYENKVIIKRKGILAKMTQGFTKGDKTIYIKQITGIDFKLGSNLTNGYIQFTLPGGNEKGKGVLEATQDENTVVFRKSQNDMAIKIKEKIEELQNADSGHKVSSAADEIKKFKELYDDGIITEEEFNKKKSELLGI